MGSKNSTASESRRGSSAIAISRIRRRLSRRRAPRTDRRA
jgi:hypothetical protein